MVAWITFGFNLWQNASLFSRIFTDDRVFAILKAAWARRSREAECVSMDLAILCICFSKASKMKEAALRRVALAVRAKVCHEPKQTRFCIVEDFVVKDERARLRTANFLATL